MIDLKMLKTGLEQLTEERRLPFDKVKVAVERALAAAYQKEYGKKGQMIRCAINFDNGEMEFEQVKTVVDENTVRIISEEEAQKEISEAKNEANRDHTLVKRDREDEEVGIIPKYNEEKHIMIDTAKLFKASAALGDEIVFPLETKDDFGRIAAQSAKQVIVQALREAEHASVVEEFSDRANQIVTGVVQRVERGIVFVDLGRATAIMPPEEQMLGERYTAGSRIRAYLYNMENDNRGLSLRLSRTHPKLLIELFKLESSEIADGVVEIISVAREAGSRSKIAVKSNDDRVDPIGACVGKGGTRVNAISTELRGEKIDIIEWSDDLEEYVKRSLSPAHTLSISMNADEKKATVLVDIEEQSLAIGKGGQNVRLAAKLTGWKIDIHNTSMNDKEADVLTTNEVETEIKESDIYDADEQKN